MQQYVFKVDFRCEKNSDCYNNSHTYPCYYVGQQESESHKIFLCNECSQMFQSSFERIHHEQRKYPQQQPEQQPQEHQPVASSTTTEGTRTDDSSLHHEQTERAIEQLVNHSNLPSLGEANSEPRVD